MLRRLVFTAVAQFLSNSPTLQVQLIVFHSLAVLMYLKLARPFESPMANALEVFNEGCILLAACHLFTFTDYVLDPDNQYLMGWSIIGVSVLNIAVNSILIMGLSLYQAWLTFKKMRARVAHWRRGSHISVLWTGVPKYKTTDLIEFDEMMITSGKLK